MKIVISGGTGFLGSWLVRYLENDHEISLLTRREMPEGQKAGNSPLAIQTDYSLESLTEILSGADLLVHLAGNRFKDEDYGLLESNLRVLNNALKAMVTNRVSRMVFASSRMVYTPYPTAPSKESDTLMPFDFYGLSKVLCEKLIQYYEGVHCLKPVVFRIAQVIGWGERIENFHMGSIDKAAHCKLPIIVFGDGMSKSNYIYIKDVCKAFERAIAFEDTSGTYNLGGLQSYTNIDYALAVSKVFLGCQNVKLEAEKKMTNRYYEMDCTKISQELGLLPEYSLMEALEDMRQTDNSDLRIS